MQNIRDLKPLKKKKNNKPTEIGHFHWTIFLNFLTAKRYFWGLYFSWIPPGNDSSKPWAQSWQNAHSSLHEDCNYTSGKQPRECSTGRWELAYLSFLYKGFFFLILFSNSAPSTCIIQERNVNNYARATLAVNSCGCLSKISFLFHGTWSLPQNLEV